MQKLTLELGRILHSSLYNRLVNFCQQYTPEFPAEPVVTTWLNSFFSGSDKVHILINLNDKWQITAHCILTVEEAFNKRVVICHQMQDDNKSGQQLSEAVEYLKKLVEYTQAECAIITVSKNAKAYEKKYNFKIQRTVMVYTTTECEQEE